MAEAIKSFPAVPSADEKTMNLQCYIEGAKSILVLASKSSIAATNQALLDIRPIFAASILEKYRLEIVRLSGDNKDAMNYAVSELGIIVAVSNALEACLHIAAGPVTAAKEINEHEDIDEYKDEADEAAPEAPPAAAA